MTDQELIAYIKLRGLGKDVATADRIEQLVKERDTLARVIDNNDPDPSLMAKIIMNSVANTCRAEEAEAKLAKAVEALRKIADFAEADVVKYIQGVDAIALDALAKLEGK
jgi:hypothetical protein